MQLFGGKNRKAFLKIKTHLPAKNRARTRAGAVGFYVAVIQHMLHEIQVSLHTEIRYLVFELFQRRFKPYNHRIFPLENLPLWP